MSGALERVAAAFLDWALVVAWQGTLLVAVLLLLDPWLRRLPAAAHHALWLLVALRVLLPPELGSPIDLLPTLAAAPAAAEAAGAPLAPLALWAAVALALTAASARARRGAWRRWRAAAVATDPACASALARVVRGVGLRRAPRVLVTAAVDGPAVTGLLRPVVLLPADLVARGGANLEHALWHELTHLARRDLWYEAAFALAGRLAWWHPGVAPARRRACAVRELACDATVARRLGGAAGGYRRSLLELALATPGAPVARHALPFLAPAPGILARLDALERAPRLSLAATRAFAVLLPLLAAAALLPARGTDAAAADDRTLAERALATLLSAPERPGCLRLRFAVARVAAARRSGS